MTEAVDPRFDDCLTLFYESVLDGGLWPRALAALSSLAGTEHGALLDLARAVVWRQVLHGIDEESTRVYLDRYALIDPRSAMLLHGQEGRWLSDHEAFDRSFRNANVVYREYLQPLEAGESVFCKLALEGSRVATITLVSHGLDTRLDPRCRELLDLALPHLDRAIRLARRLSAFALAIEFGKGTLAAVDEPIACVARDGEVVLANRAFEALLRGGEPFAVADERLRLAASGRLNAEFLLAVEEACDLADGVMLRPPRSRPTLQVRGAGGASYVVSVAPLARTQGQGWLPRRGALVKVTDLSASPDEALLKRAFELTPAESRLAASVLLGGRQADMAQRIGVSLNTVKSQMAALYSKTGCRSRAELVNLLRSLPR